MTTRSQTKIEGRNIEVTTAIKEYAESKIARIHKHFDSLIQNHEIRMTLSVVKNKKGSNQKAEITINLKGGHVIRCNSSEENVYAGIDVVVDKIEAQLRKYKTKIYSKIHAGKSVKEYGITGDLSDKAVPVEMLEQVQQYETPKIIKVKRFVMQAMEPEQAVEMLNDCGHPFYMFLNIYSNKIACVYEREDGGFGLIEPEHLQVQN
ncbi:MAG: ribosome-associated translation inhibitor RaiA [Candidatus Caenarcaniphilales bacterium]|jgi:putative sigma-54 modulation protein|nr:ribosome-associated translation inhibitor RaiA [Candidatus Caenarcaniphilales bacterium]